MEPPGQTNGKSANAIADGVRGGGAAGRCLLLLLAGFILCTALDLNGSSISFWSGIQNDASTADALLLFKPRQARSDEWLVWTPSILAQANHRPPYPVENPAVGAGKSPLIMSLPARHYSMLFRPQLYGFFLLGAERGFSWYWNMKIFGLLASMFALFYLLSGGRLGLALCGAALVFTAGYVQWFFSCPPMLPEMLSMWALALICIITLGGTCGPAARVAATAGLVVAVVNFVLCCYPPFQIPLIYLGAAILCGWFWQRRGGNVPPSPAAPVIASYSIAALGVCAVLVPFFIECLPTLHMVAGTAYPGARRTHGGGITFANLLRGVAAPLVFEHSFPEMMDNAGDASGFFPFALAALPLVLTGLWRDWRNRKLLLPSCALLCFLVFFSLAPMPQWMANVTGLSLTTTERWVLPIGLAGIFIAVLHLPEVAKASARLRAVAWFIAMGVAGCWIADAARMNPAFLTVPRMLSLAAGSGIVFAGYLTGRTAVFMICSLGILAPAALSVNPVVQGLSPLLESPAAAAVREIASSDPDAGWVAYDSSFLSQFLMAQGVPVLSGAKTVPDLRFFDELDPARAFRGIYNRYGIAVYQAPPEPEQVGFRLVNFCGYDVIIDPANPILRREGVRYFLFPHPVRAAGLELLKAIPGSRMWIYRAMK